MARPWRIQFPDAVYHVASRGNNRQDIFLDDHDRHTCLTLLEEAHPRFQLHLFAFCLMTNHYHLFLRTPQANLAAFMHWFNGTYTARFNRRHHRLGHLLQGRYKAVLVTDQSHWLHLSMYLHLNPVRAKLVEDPADYPWSSFRDYTRPRSRFGWLKPEAVLAEYGRTEAEQRRRYRAACLGLAGVAGDFWEELRSAAVLGSRAQLEELARRHRPSGKAEAVPEFQRVRRPPVEIEPELLRVARAFGLEPESLLQPRRNHGARLAAYHHLVEHCGIRVTEVARRMGVGPSAVSWGLRSLGERMSQDQALRQRVQALTHN